MSTAEIQFEPMSLGELLDRAFRLYAANFPLMVGIAAVAFVPQFFVQVLAVLPVPAPSSLVTVLAASFGILAFLVGSLIVAPLATGATTKALSERYLGREVTVGEALRAAWSRVGVLLLTQFIVGLIVIFGFMLFIVPGVLWMCSYALVAPVVMLETADLGEIRLRSWELVSGHRGKVFVILLVIVAIQSFLGSAGNLLFLAFEEGSLASGVFSVVFLSSVGLLVYPLQTIAVTLLYYDLRIRKEGFDLELLSQAIGPAPAPR
jgi:hypothetical protein